MENSNFESGSVTRLQPEYAGFWIRVLALFIDALIMILPGLALNLVLPVFGSLFLGILYKPFFESSALQATPGKALLGLRVTTLDGGRITFKQSFIRYLSYLVSTIILFVGCIMVAFTQKKQGLHDMIAETLVVKQVSPTVNYLEAWVDEVQSVFNIGKTSTEGRGPVASAAAPVSSYVTTQIEELHQLYAKGILTEEEFTRKKQELLSKI
jgi:uncharacterized RDD family membrane protein YckC